MAISQAVCNTFKRDLLKGFHDFASGGSTFKIALFTSSASLDATTENYSTTNEITNTSGSAYTAGGETLTGQSVTGGTSASTAYVDFSNDPQWTSASFTANGAMIYNTTTWVSTNAPQVLLYACLIEAFKYLKGPYDLLAQYDKSYQQAVERLQIEQQGRRRRDEYQDGVIRVPLQSQQP